LVALDGAFKSSTKQKKFKQTLTVCQKAHGKRFLGNERRTDGGINMMRYLNNVRSVLRNIKICAGSSRKKCGMLSYGLVLLHGNVRPHTAARIRALLKQFNWELFDPHYSPDLTPSDNHLFTYLKDWLGSQHFNNNEDLTEGVKT
jgi:transposase